MKFLLKIVQGPNAGAEIALVEGVRVTLGSADSCDIVLADPTLAPEACAIEATADAVLLTVPGAEPEDLPPLRVRSFGTTALAVGPADAPWGPLDWAAPAASSGGSGGDAPRSLSDPAAPENAPLQEGGGGSSAGGSTPPSSPSPSGGSGGTPGRLARRIGWLVLLLLLLLLAAWLLLRYRAGSASPDGPAPSGPVESPPADPAGVTIFETNGVLHARGDFATRAERLAATAALYEAHPGIKLDLADRETLLSSTTDLLQAATEGTLTVSDVTNRVAVLAGHAPDPVTLKAALDALRVDVPRLAGFDTAAVILDSPLATPTGGSGVSPDHLARPSPASSARKQPQLPLCGILLQPYPCLVLQNGQRLAIGAELGGYKIVEIAPDRVKVRNTEEEELEWTP